MDISSEAGPKGRIAGRRLGDSPRLLMAGRRPGLINRWLSGSEPTESPIDQLSLPEVRDGRPLLSDAEWERLKTRLASAAEQLRRSFFRQHQDGVIRTGLRKPLQRKAIQRLRELARRVALDARDTYLMQQEPLSAIHFGTYAIWAENLVHSTLWHALTDSFGNPAALDFSTKGFDPETEDLPTIVAFIAAVETLRVFGKVRLHVHDGHLEGVRRGARRSYCKADGVTLGKLLNALNTLKEHGFLPVSERAVEEWWNGGSEATERTRATIARLFLICVDGTFTDESLTTVLTQLP